MQQTIFQRNIQPRLLTAMLDTPVVLLSGPRQSGKTTLVCLKAGFVLYDGTQTLPLGRVEGKPLWAMPISALTER
jgi:predicted AAA+ superfamily ATPase